MGERDVSVPARAIGEPARARMLTALVGGRHVPAGELARAAGVAPSTASGHLQHLVDAGLVVVTSSGRSRLYALAGDEVAVALEALQELAPEVPVRSWRQSRISVELREGRTCYDHLAGVLGVRLGDLLVRTRVVPRLRPRAVVPDPLPLPDHPVVTTLRLGDLAPEQAGSRRPWLRTCQDWSERRPHVAGALGRHVLDVARDEGWVEPRGEGRAVRLTERGEQVLAALEAAS